MREVIDGRCTVCGHKVKFYSCKVRECRHAYGVCMCARVVRETQAPTTGRACPKHTETDRARGAAA